MYKMSDFAALIEMCPYMCVYMCVCVCVCICVYVCVCVCICVCVCLYLHVYTCMFMRNLFVWDVGYEAITMQCFKMLNKHINKANIMGHGFKPSAQHSLESL